MVNKVIGLTDDDGGEDDVKCPKLSLCVFISTVK